jgi:Uma2 family endonuclease
MTDMIRAEGEARNRDARLEVIDGDLVEEERNVSWQQMLMVRWLFLMMHEHVVHHELGTIYPDGARYILSGVSPSIIGARIPDLSFLRKGRLSDDFNSLNDFQGAPNLAVEILSSGQVNADLLKKIAEFLSAGTEEVWYILSRRRVLQRFRTDMDGVETFAPGDTLETPVLPGFKLSLTDLFNARNVP